MSIVDLEEVWRGLQWLHISPGTQGEELPLDETVQQRTSLQWAAGASMHLCSSSSTADSHTKFQHEKAFYVWMSLISFSKLLLIFRLLLICAFIYIFLLQAFLGDLFQQHHKDVSADKLEEYTDTMVALRFIIVLRLWSFLWQTLASLCCVFAEGL